MAHLGETKRGSDTHFHNAIRKYGIENFRWDVLEICQDINSLNEQEQYYIAYYRSTNRVLGYNLQSGGLNFTMSEETCKKLSKLNSGENNAMFGKCGKDSPNYGKNHSKQTKEKMRQSHLGKKFTKEHIENIRQANVGKSLSEETKMKIGKAQKGKIVSEVTRKKMSTAASGKRNGMYGKTGDKNPFYGKKHSQESRQKMSAAQKGEKSHNYGKKFSAETREKMRIVWQTRKMKG